jgi:hypothetical protein
MGGVNGAFLMDRPSGKVKLQSALQKPQKLKKATGDDPVAFFYKISEIIP